MPTAAKPRVELLGPVQIRSEHGCDPVTDTTASVLARLVLADGAPVPVEHLKRYQPRQGSEQTIETHVSNVRVLLRKHGVEIPRKKGNSYRVPKGTVAVDALEFIDGVADLPDDGDPERMRKLYALWRGDPRPWVDLAAQFENKILSAYKRLTVITRSCQNLDGAPEGAEGFLASIPSDDDELPSATVPDEPAGTGQPLAPTTAARLAASRQSLASPAPLPAPGSPARPRILIVEDDPVLEALYRQQLDNDYECVFVRNIGEWWSLRDGPLDFDAAIVDRCLTSGNMDDDGYDVLKDLRGSSFAKAVVSGHPDYDRPDVEFKREYDIDIVVNKNPSRRESGPPIRTVVHELLKLRAGRAAAAGVSTHA